MSEPCSRCGFSPSGGTVEIFTEPDAGTIVRDGREQSVGRESQQPTISHEAPAPTRSGGGTAPKPPEQGRKSGAGCGCATLPLTIVIGLVLVAIGMVDDLISGDGIDFDDERTAEEVVQAVELEALGQGIFVDVSCEEGVEEGEQVAYACVVEGPVSGATREFEVRDVDGTLTWEGRPFQQIQRAEDRAF